MWAPIDAGPGFAKITISMPESKRPILPATFKMMIVGDPQDVPTLAAALQDDDEAMRRRLESMFGYHSQIKPHSDAVIGMLIKQFEDPDRGVRFRAVRGLTSFKTQQVLDVMIRALDDPDAGVRIVAIQAMGGFGPHSPDVADALVDALDDADGAVALAMPGHRRAAATQQSRSSGRPEGPPFQGLGTASAAARDAQASRRDAILAQGLEKAVQAIQNPPIGSLR